MQFTKKIDARVAELISAYTIKKYRFDYHAEYGSARKNEQEVKVESVRVSSDRLSLDILLPKLTAGHVYQFELNNLKSSSQENLASSLCCYNLIEIRDKYLSE